MSIVKTVAERLCRTGDINIVSSKLQIQASRTCYCSELWKGQKMKNQRFDTSESHDRSPRRYKRALGRSRAWQKIESVYKDWRMQIESKENGKG